MPDRPHIIRLRGPWDFEPLSRTRLLPDGSTCVEASAGLPPAGSAKMPVDWGETLGLNFYGRVRYTRRFGRPSRLEPGDVVELVIGQVDALGAARLNGESLVEIPAGQLNTRVDITRWLLPRNELQIEVELPRVDPTAPPLPRSGREDQPGGLVGEVRLEILPGGSNDG